MLRADAKAGGHAVELVRGQTGGATLASSSSRRRVEMDGETLYTQALEEQNKLEEEIQLAFELPINYMVG